MSDGQAPRAKILEIVQSALDLRARAIREHLEHGLSELVQDTTDRLREPLDGELGEDLLPSATPPTGGDALARLRESVDDLACAPDQVSLLNGLVTGAARFASRSALFVVRQGSAIGWTAHGFGVDDIRQCSVALDRPSPLAEAITEGEAVIVDGPEGGRPVAMALEAGGSDRTAALPITLGTRVVGVLFCDAGEAGTGGMLDLDALRILVRFATAQLAGLRGQGRPAGRRNPATVERRPSQAWAPSSVATGSVEIGGSVMEPAPAGSAVETTSAAAPPAAPPTETFDAPRTPAASEPDAPRPAGDAHEEARRFARLLVSEILLYNEARVEEGRRNADLYDRLREDLERSEQMYRQRAAAEVVGSTDYFHEEVLRTLANGDPQLLGPR